MNERLANIPRARQLSAGWRPGLLNLALWRFAWGEVRTLLAACAALMFGFHWLFVWLTSQIELGALGRMVAQIIPPAWQKLLPVPIGIVATNAGMVSMAYVEPIVVIVILVWSIGRGSDAVSGPLDRGTLEMLLAQPLRRSDLYSVQALVTVLGAALISTACWLGTCVGLWLVPLPEPVSAAWYLPAAVNVFALMVFLSGASSLLSSAHRYRWQTIGWMGFLFALAMITKAIALMGEGWGWLIYLSFLGAFEPVLLVNDPEPWVISLRYSGTLLGLGVLAYVAGGVIFARRDLPAPV